MYISQKFQDECIAGGLCDNKIYIPHYQWAAGFDYFFIILQTIF